MQDISQLVWALGRSGEAAPPAVLHGLCTAAHACLPAFKPQVSGAQGRKMRECGLLCR
jgi:hypothetical protein